jgi:iron-sulfur cluster repair protein YtfE (RIC family)
MSIDHSLALTERSGLPDALRILLFDFPREAWEANGNFGGLVRFWLERHLMFRRISAVLAVDGHRFLEGRIDDREFAVRLSRYGGHLVSDLHGHHLIEDSHYFPVLARTEPRIARGFEILDRDHHDLDGLLAGFTGAANAVLSAVGQPGKMRTAAGVHLEGLSRFALFLDRHLTDEEDLVVPVILRHGEGGLG